MFNRNRLMIIAAMLLALLGSAPAIAQGMPPSSQVENTCGGVTITFSIKGQASYNEGDCRKDVLGADHPAENIICNGFAVGVEGSNVYNEGPIRLYVAVDCGASPSPGSTIRQFAGCLDGDHFAEAGFRITVTGTRNAPALAVVCPNGLKPSISNITVTSVI